MLFKVVLVVVSGTFRCFWCWFCVVFVVLVVVLSGSGG